MVFIIVYRRYEYDKFLCMSGFADHRLRDPACADLTAARGRKGFVMRMPTNTKPLIQGAVGAAG